MIDLLPGRARRLPGLLSTAGWAVTVEPEDEDRIWLIGERGAITLTSSWVLQENKRWRNFSGYTFRSGDRTFRTHHADTAIRMAGKPDVELLDALVAP